MALTQGERITLAAAAAAAVVLGLAGAKKAPGAAAVVPSSQTEDMLPFDPPPDRPVLGPAQHVGGVSYTPHRYPVACGSELTTLIHHGLSTAALPAEDDMLWLSAPPSEGEL